MSKQQLHMCQNFGGLVSLQNITDFQGYLLHDKQMAETAHFNLYNEDIYMYIYNWMANVMFQATPK